MLDRLQRLNEMLARWAASGSATMTCFYLFFGWSILPLIVTSSRDIVFYVSGGIFQLILLPLMGVNTKLESRKLETRAQQDHDAIMEELQLHKSEIRELKEIHADLRNLISKLNG